MSSSGTDRDGAFERPFADDSAEESGEPAGDGDLMEQVLQETLAATDVHTPLEPGELEALKDVARRHHGQTQMLAPVAVELVEAVLSTRFASLSDVAWRSAAATIAETLMDDPVSRDRLQSLWTRLCEAA